MNDIRSTFGKLKGKELWIAIIAVVIMLAIYFSTMSCSSDKPATTERAESNYCTDMRDELRSAIVNLTGDKNASVVISWESSVEIVTAQQTSSTSTSSSSSTQVINNSGESHPIVIKEIYPQALGVIVVCKGGNDAAVKVKITLAVATLLNISSEKVLVYGNF